MNPSLAESMGVDTEKLLISQPDCAENLLSMVDTLTKSGSIDVIVVDSVCSLIIPKNYACKNKKKKKGREIDIERHYAKDFLRNIEHI